jgi:hypothetical protein
MSIKKLYVSRLVIIRLELHLPKSQVTVTQALSNVVLSGRANPFLVQLVEVCTETIMG